MRLNVASTKTRLQKLERYIAELKKQQTLSIEQFERDFLIGCRKSVSGCYRMLH